MLHLEDNHDIQRIMGMLSQNIQLPHPTFHHRPLMTDQNNLNILHAIKHPQQFPD